jgi:hypothetical protein
MDGWMECIAIATTWSLMWWGGDGDGDTLGGWIMISHIVET